MAKNKISEYSSTAANNTDIGGIDIAEGCAPSGINNAIRELMAQLKDQQAGTDGDNLSVGGNLSVTGTSALTGAVTITGAVASASDITIAAASKLIGNVTGNVVGNATGNLISVSNTITAGSFIVGNTYVIASVGTTDFQLIGASASTVGIRFTATGVGTGTGTATTFTGRAVNVTGIVAIENGGTGATSFTQNAVILGNGTSAPTSVLPSTNGNFLTSTVGATVTAGSFVIGTQYTILSVGSTNFMAIGASANTVGVVFTATGAGSGDGTATTNVWTSATYTNTPAALSTASGSAPSYSARAYANIDASTVVNITGSYARTSPSTTVTVTTSSAHPFRVGDTAYLNFTSGTGLDGAYTIVSTSSNTNFTITTVASTTTAGTITVPTVATRKAANVSSVSAATTTTSASLYYVNFTTDMPDANYAPTVTVSAGTVAVTATTARTLTVDTGSNNVSIVALAIFD
jgi:hypothetical protein